MKLSPVITVISLSMAMLSLGFGCGVVGSEDYGSSESSQEGDSAPKVVMRLETEKFSDDSEKWEPVECTITESHINTSEGLNNELIQNLITLAKKENIKTGFYIAPPVPYKVMRVFDDQGFGVLLMDSREETLQIRGGIGAKGDMSSSVQLRTILEQFCAGRI